VGKRQDMFGHDCGIHHPEEVGNYCEKSLREVDSDCGATSRLENWEILTAWDMLE